MLNSPSHRVELGYAEVQNLDEVTLISVGNQIDVIGFEIAMDDAGIVCTGQPLKELCSERVNFAD